MKVKFVSKLNKMSEIVFLVLSKKSALKNIGLNDKHIKSISNKNIDVIILLNKFDFIKCFQSFFLFF